MKRDPKRRTARHAPPEEGNGVPGCGVKMRGNGRAMYRQSRRDA